ncbi:NAD(P)-dependent alcohol dehydrogenase [Blastococcus sp. SYSU D00820]
MQSVDENASLAAGTQMRAVVHERYGTDPEAVLDARVVERPAPGPGEVLVRVAAASVDYGTWHVLAGRPLPVRAGFGLRRPRALNPGRSLAGTVAAVGPGVPGFAVGDAVYGTGTAALAEYAVADPARLAAAPTGLTPVQAAALPVSGLTALQAVRDHGRVGPGQQVLVTGAAGGVGSLAVQIALAAGAEVTGVCRTPAKVDAVRALGATTVVDAAAELPAGRYDVVVDTGGRRPIAALRRLLTPRGRLVVVGGENGGRWLGGFQRQLGAALLSPFVRQTLGMFVSSENSADLAVLAGMAERGEVVPLVDRVFPLEEAGAAVRHLVEGRATGKVVVAVG